LADNVGFPRGQAVGSGDECDDLGQVCSFDVDHHAGRPGTLRGAHGPQHDPFTVACPRPHNDRLVAGGTNPHRDDVHQLFADRPGGFRPAEPLEILVRSRCRHRQLVVVVPDHDRGAVTRLRHGVRGFAEQTGSETVADVAEDRGERIGLRLGECSHLPSPEICRTPTSSVATAEHHAHDVVNTERFEHFALEPRGPVVLTAPLPHSEDSGLPVHQRVVLDGILTGPVFELENDMRGPDRVIESDVHPSRRNAHRGIHGCQVRAVERDLFAKRVENPCPKIRGVGCSPYCATDRRFQPGGRARRIHEAQHSPPMRD